MEARAPPPISLPQPLAARSSRSSRNPSPTARPLKYSASTARSPQPRKSTLSLRTYRPDADEVGNHVPTGEDSAPFNAAKLRRRQETLTNATSNTERSSVALDLEKRRNLDLEDTLPTLLLQASIMYLAIEDKNIENFRTLAGGFDRSWTAVLDSITHLFSSTRPSGSFMISRHIAVTTHETFMNLIWNDSEARRFVFMRLCADILDFVLDTVKAFMEEAHKELSRPKGQPEVTEDYGDEDQVPVSTASASSGSECGTQSSSSTLLDECNMLSLDGDTLPEEPSVMNKSEHPHLEANTSIDIRASVVRAYEKAPPRNSLWDVQLPADAALEIVMSNSNDGKILGASLAAIIYKLTTPDAVGEHGLADTLFTCFRDFTSPTDLAKALEARYHARPSLALSIEQTEAWRLQSRGTQLRVVNLFRTWLDYYWIEEADNCASSLISNFANMIGRDWPRAGSNIHKALATAHSVNSTHRRFEKRQLEVLAEAAPKCRGTAYSTTFIAPLLDDLCKPDSGAFSVRLLKITDNLKEFGRQLTLMAHRLYTSVIPEELLRHMMGEKQEKISRSLTDIATFHNATTGWVTMQILEQPDPKSRAKYIKIFLCLAQVLHDLRNYDSLTAIIHGIQQPSVARMEQTHSELSSDSKKLLHRMEEFLELSSNHKKLRMDMDSSCEPTVPLMPMYLHSLESLLEGPNRRRVAYPASPDGSLPNIHIYHSAAKCIRAMEQWHQAYRFPDAYNVQSWIKNEFDRISKIGVDALWDRAYGMRALEPANQKKRSRSMRMSSLASFLPKNGNKISETASLKSFTPHLTPPITGTPHNTSTPHL